MTSLSRLTAELRQVKNPLPLSDEETLLMAKWLEKAARVNGHVTISKETALRLAETLWWAVSESKQLIGEPAP